MLPVAVAADELAAKSAAALAVVTWIAAADHYYLFSAELAPDLVSVFASHHSPAAAAVSMTDF